ncbi:dihydrofolate reductase [Candidatus Woesearchaeota archaeon]|nr:dihydrofolate reductase [Candidatus Woesearchaeota archaeon]
MVSIIAAMTKNQVIGRANQLPWSLPEDLRNFKRLTTGNVVIMGRKTYDSIGRSLPNRHNIVVSRNTDQIPGVIVSKSIEEAIATAKEFGREIFVIGGAQIYQQALPYATKLYLSLVKHDHEGDTYFPPFDLKEWQEEERQDYSDFTFVVYIRNS